MVKVLKRLPPRISDKTKRHIRSELVSTASQMMMYFAPQFEDEEWYRLVIPAEQADVMTTASKLMPKVARWSTARTIRLNLFNLPVEASYPSSIDVTAMSMDREHVDWLYPEKLNWITPESKLNVLLPVIDIGIRWKTQIELFTRCAEDHTPAMISALLPWLKTYLASLDLKYTDTDIVRDINKIINAGQPRIMPGQSRWYASLCRDGGALVTQYIFVRDKKFDCPKGKVYVVPILNDELVPKELTDHHNEFVKAMCEAEDWGHLS